MVAIGRVGQASERFPPDILENWELCNVVVGNIGMSNSLLLSHIFKSYSIRYVTREELVAAMEKVTQGLREEIRSFFFKPLVVGGTTNGGLST